MPPKPAVPRTYPARIVTAILKASLLGVTVSVLSGCGGSSAMTVAPIVLSVSISQNPIQITAGGAAVYVQVLIVAPTETASFAIGGLPGGVSASYKESESNPSGQLTLMAISSTVAGSYPCTVTVGSSGQTASTMVKVNVLAAAKA